VVKGMNLSVRLGGLSLKNPVITASGTFGHGREYSEYVDLNSLGAIVTKGVSLRPMEGNPPPRICETPCGMLNAIGLQNQGLDAFLRDELPFLRSLDTKVIVNILGQSIDEYVELAERLDSTGVDAIELNVSCPNVEKGGITFGKSRRLLAELIEDVKRRIHLPLIIKLSPDTGDIGKFAKVAEGSGADIISLINTIPGMSIDIRQRRPRLANIIGGLSGPAIKPIALRMVWECYNTVKIPIIGMGGIVNAEDAIEFMLAGASAVAVGTGNFINPRATMDVLEGMRSFMRDEGIRDINQLIGGLRCIGH